MPRGRAGRREAVPARPFVLYTPPDPNRMPMYRILTTLTLFAALLWSGCAGPARTTDRPTPAADLERPLPDPVLVPATFEQAVETETRTTTGVPGPAYWTQSAAYTMTARLFPEDRLLEGSARIVYHNNAPDTLYELHMELVQNLHQAGVVRNTPAEITGGVDLQRLVVDGAELTALEELEEEPGYFIEGTQMIVIPRAPVPPGASVEIETDWAFVVPQAGASGRMGYDADNLFFLAYWYPQMAVYDDVVGWHTEPFLGQAEFYADFADYDVTVEVPADWLVMGSGALQNAEAVLAPDVLERMRRAYASDEPVTIVAPDRLGSRVTQAGDGGRLRWHFTGEELRDFAFSATRASVWEGARTPVGDRDGDGEVDYTHINTFYREPAFRWQQVTRYQQHAITFLSAYTGFPYPWPHMTAVEGSGIIGGGMEFPMMTLMGDYTAAGDTALYNVTAHELAHMWVPMIVNTNERRYSWMDEGTTTFNENMARADFYPGEVHRLDDQAFYLWAAENEMEGEIMRWSDYHYPGLGFGIASYMKPATVLAALRGLLGEETFNRAYRTFIETWAYKHPYPYDLFNLFEQVSGRDLDWFWRTWYYETWTLDQAVADVRTRDGETTVTIADLGRAPMPVDLVLTLAGGETIRREIPVDVWLRGDREAVLTVETPAPVERVEIDPEYDFPDLDRSNNVWER